MAGTVIGFGGVALNTTRKNISVYRTPILVEETDTNTDTHMCVGMRERRRR